MSNFIVIRETGSVFCVADSTLAGDTRGVIIPSKLCDLSGTQVTGLVLVRSIGSPICLIRKTITILSMQWLATEVVSGHREGLELWQKYNYILFRLYADVSGEQPTTSIL